MRLYKLTDQNMQTYGGFQFELGKVAIAKGNSSIPCSAGVLHAYTDPRLAIIFNPVHANIKNPRLFVLETNTYIGTDGTKCWSKTQTLKEEICIPKITLEQKVEFVIRVSLLVYSEPKFVLWANNWISNIDRTADAARCAAEAAYDAARCAADAAYAAARATDADAAYTAARCAADAAYAAAYATDADAAYAAYAYAAYAAYAAAANAYADAAAKAAAYAADAAKAAAYAARAAAAAIDFIHILDIMGISK